MSDNFGWNDAALARSLGTKDPATLQLVKEYLEMPNAELALTCGDRADPYDGTEPELEVVDTAEVVDAIFARHGHLCRP